MSAQSHHTASGSLPQAVAAPSDAWATEVVPTLPPDLAAQAHALGAFVRTRALAVPADLLRGLLAYVLCAPAFRLLGCWGVLSGVADISATAWRKRLRAASPWLLWLLGALLPAQPAAPWLTQRVRGRVWLVDATTLAQQGGSGDDWRLHLGYDLLAGRMGQVVVTDRRGAETLAHFRFQPGDIVVADGGYGARRQLAAAAAQQADCVLRIVPTTFPLERSTGTPLDLVAWLGQGGPALRSRIAYCTWAGQRYRVRVIALRLPELQQRSAQARARRNALRHGRQVRDQTLMLAGWLLLVTTVPAATWSAAEVVALYQARWQIEVVFKRMKQLLRLQALRARTAATAEATIRAILVAWALQERTSTALQAELRAASQVARAPEAWRWTSADVVSSWQVVALGVETLRQQVRGAWSHAAVQGCLPQLRRYVVSHPRARGHQASQTWAWLTGVQFTPPMPLRHAG